MGMSHSRRKLHSTLAALALIAGLVAVTPLTASAFTGADHLVFTLEPASGSVDDAIHVTVNVLDDGEEAGSSDQITLTLDSGPFDAGTQSVAASSGVADFTDLEIHTPGTYTITAHDDTTTVPDITSDPFTLAAGAPDKLKFDAQPTDTFSEVAMSDFTVDILDQYGNQTEATHDIELTLSTGLFSGGTNPQAAENGVATFDDMTVLDPGAYTITAADTTDEGVTGDESIEFDILPHADLQLTMSAATSQVAGTDAVYAVSVKNYGPNPNVSYKVSATLPTDATFDGSQSGTGCSESGGTITCSRTGGVDLNDTDTFNIALAIPANYVDGVLPPLTRNLSFTATLTDTSPTQQPNDTQINGATVSREVHGEADLDITQTMSYIDLPATFPVAPQLAGNRHSVRYVVTVTNVGPSNAQNVTLADTLPSSALDVASAKVCAVVSGSCTATVSYTNGTAYPPSGAPTLAPAGTYIWTFQAPVKTGLRDRPNATNSVTAASPTADPGTDSDNRSDSQNAAITTVPDAPNLIAAEPGNASIAVQWRPGDDFDPSGDSGTGGDPITKWVIIVRVGATKNVYVRTDAAGVAGVTHAASGDISVVVPGAGGGAALTNGTNYSVTVAARNGAGDSDESSAISAKPCATCVIRLLGTGQTTLNTASLSVGAGPCFPPSTDSTKPGATSGDPVVSCFQLTSAQAAAKAGFVTALRETGVVSGQYDCGTGTCVGGNQAVSLLIPPGQGSDTQIIQTVLYDKTVASSVYGDLCNALPCPSKAKVYDVFLNSTFIGSSLTNGDPSTARPAWCTLQTPQKFDPKNPTAGFNPVTNPYVIPAGKTACVVSYVHLNTSQAASKINGNTPNGKEGNGDFRLDIVFLGDGGLSSCRTCK
jgi:hypothetical protein